MTNGTFTAGGGHAGSWVNNGSVVLVNSPSTFAGLVTMANLQSVVTDGPIVVTGNFVNTGSVLDLDALPGATFDFGYGASVTGGTIAGSGVYGIDSYISLYGVTLAADLTIEDGGIVYVYDGLTLSGADLTLASSGGAYAQLYFQFPAALNGSGQVLFAGTTTYDYTNYVASSYPLTVGAGVTLRTISSGGQLYVSGGLDMQGSMISDLAGRSVTVNNSSMTVGGSLSIGANARIVANGSSIVLQPGSAVDIDIGSAGTGVLESSAGIAFDGTVNFALVGGFTPAPCQVFDAFDFASHSGTFASINGPDFGGGTTFDMIYFASKASARRPGTGCTVNLSLLAGVTVTESSIYSVSYDGELAVDGINSTSSSWCTANNDPAPSLRVDFGVNRQVNSLAIKTSYSPSYDFLSGRFIARNAVGTTVYNSGVVALTNGAITLDVIPDAAGVRSVEFQGVTWNSIEPCLAEFEIFGPHP